MSNYLVKAQDGSISIGQMLEEYVAYATFGNYEYTESEGLKLAADRSDFQNAIELLQKARTEILCMNNTQAADRAYIEYIDAKTSRETYIETQKNYKRNLETMRDELNRWTPPSDSHKWIKENLSGTIVNTLTRTIDNLSFYENLSKIIEKDPGLWINDRLENIAAAISQHEQDRKDRIEVRKTQQEFIDLLKSSISSMNNRENW